MTMSEESNNNQSGGAPIVPLAERDPQSATHPKTTWKRVAKKSVTAKHSSASTTRKTSSSTSRKRKAPENASSSKKPKLAPVSEENVYNSTSKFLLDKTFRMGDVPTRKSLSLFVAAPGAPVVDYRDDLNFDYAASVLETLLEQNPDCSLFLCQDVESISLSGSLYEVKILYAFIANETPPKFLRLQKDATGDSPIRPFDDYFLDWINLEDLTGDPTIRSFANKHPDRIKLLAYKGRPLLSNISNDDIEKWTRAKLMDCRSSEYHERYNNKIVVRADIAGEVDDKAYAVSFRTAGMSFRGIFDEIEDQVGFELDPDQKEPIKERVKALIVEKRNQAEKEAAANLDEYDTAKVDRIKVAKIYPSNVGCKELALKAATQVLKQQLYNLPPHQKQDDQARLEELRQAQATFQFQTQPTSVVGYGPVDQGHLFTRAATGTATLKAD
ncbi:MAG: hypothetical protein SGILL_005517 [Bacillariaceae sp.]